MSTKIVHNGNTNFGYLYIDYYFTKDTNARTWKLYAALKLHIPSGYYVDAWINTGAHTATLQKNGGDGYSGGEHTLVASKQVASGSYNDNGDAPTASVSWAWNVNSSYCGYVNPHGTASVTGSSIDPMGLMRIKQSGSWKKGKTWIKVSGTWKKAKAVWIKVSGTWKKSK